MNLGAEARSVLFSFLTVTTVIIFSTCLAMAQGVRGSISGTVTDTTGAVVPNASVVATEVDTNVQNKTTSNKDGIYRFPSLSPGTYEISVGKQGFKTAVVKNISLNVAGTLTVDLKLQVGAVRQQVNVTSQAPVIETSPAPGSHVSPKEFKSWPIMIGGDGHRLIQSFIFSSLPGTEGSSFQGSINGGQAYSHEILIDGIPLGRFDLTGGSNNELSPSADAVSQFKVQTGAFNASFGGGETAVANFAIKSGTNHLHGTAYSYIGNEAFDANGFSNNALGKTHKPENRIINWGFAVGGPMVFPKIYNGRNKTFWFLNLQHTKHTALGYSGFSTLPTADMKNGNFSAFLGPQLTNCGAGGNQPCVDALGRPVLQGQIYDPATTRMVNGREVRDPFPGNIIPGSRINPVAQNYVNLLPDPTYNRLLNNMPIFRTSAPFFFETMVTARIDHTINAHHRISGVWISDGRRRNNTPVPGWSAPPGNPLERWQNQITPGRMIRVSEDWVISPSLLNHAAIGYNRFGNLNRSVYFGQNYASKLGVQNVGPNAVPQMIFGGPSALGGSIATLGSDFTYGSYNGSTIFLDQLTWMHGRHQLSFGFQGSFYYENNRNFANSGHFHFSPLQTQLAAYNNETGNAFASFLLGQVASADHNIILNNPGFRHREYASYATDSWKVNSKLTLNLGVRWTVIGGVFESHQRETSLNPTLPNAAAGNIDGALAFASQLHQNGFMTPWYGQVEPRIGFAYAITPKLVFRGGYGASHKVLTTNFSDPSTFGYNGAIEVNRQNTSLAFPDSQVLNISQPFPNFNGTLPDFNPTAANGLSVGYIAPHSNKVGWVHNFNLGFQYLVARDTSLSVGYVGNVANGLTSYGMGNLNQQPLSALQYGNALLDPLSQHPGLVPLPYSGFTGTVAQALAPYPQYTAVSYYLPHFGWSDYNSLQVEVNHRFTKGLGFLVAYTFSKALSNVSNALYGISMQNVHDRKLERALQQYDQPQQLKISWIYNLPFGPNRRFRVGGVAGEIVGGWQLSAIQNYHSGDVLSITESNYNNPLNVETFRPNRISGQPVILNGSSPINFGGGNSSLPLYLNPAAFADIPTTAGGIPLGIGTAPRVQPSTRGPFYASEDFSLMKQFALGSAESRNLQFRMDATNILNHVGRGDPVTNIDNPEFGMILGPQQGGRAIQLSLRLNF